MQIVGALNVTPDSYHDGGKYMGVESALARAEQMLQDGVDIIEIGGESTGPKSLDVSVDEELRRTIPVIDGIRKKFPDVRLSIDTYKSAVAKEALQSGVMMINDVTAGRGDAAMFEIVAQSNASIVLMFAKDSTPRTTIAETPYENVIETVAAFLRARRDAAVKQGIHPEKIILDPGMGHFVSSNPKYSFEILARLKEFLALGCPLFVSPSRKSFLAGPENLKTADRLPGTLAASAVAVLNGARYIRTHDVLEVRSACEIAEAIRHLSP